MTPETISAFSDQELAEAKAWILEEEQTRAQRRKQKAIADIKSSAALNGLSVAIEGTRGRPMKTDISKQKSQPRAGSK